MGIDVIKVKWAGKVGTINAKEAFTAAEAMEDHITIFELAQVSNDFTKIKLARISKAYAALLNVAGLPADAKEVRSKLASAMASKDGLNVGDFVGEVMGVVGQMLAILTDGQIAEGEPEENAGNVEAPTDS